jgi:DNA repair exonuclease SbcCD ATPase subunit
MTPMSSLRVINFKSIADMQIEPKGHSITLSGANGAGKSALIDAIRWILQGNAHISEDVIRKGENEVKVLYEDDKFVITRAMKRGKTATIKVTDKSGVAYKSPQGMLDDLVNNLSFDPTAFLEMKSDKQVEALRALVDPKGEIAGMGQDAKLIYDKRRDVGRDRDRIKNTLDTMPKPTKDGLVEISQTEILGRYEEARSLIQEKERLRAREAETEVRVEKLKLELEQAEKEHKEFAEKLWNSPESPDISSIKSELDNADALNAKIRDNQKYNQVENELKEIDKNYAFLETSLSAVRAKIASTIKSSAIPVDGMAFDENGITLDGKRFDECSDGERLEASLRISMALNKGLKMIAIKNGSLLDEERRSKIMKFARANGYQVIMEVVGSGEIHVEIEVETEIQGDDG